MRIGFLVNTLVAGTIVLLVWLADYHYSRRLSKKLPGKLIEEYREFAKELQSQPFAELPPNFSTSDFHYVYNDTVYIELYNYLSVNQSTLAILTGAFEKAYANRFENVHRIQVYVKQRRWKRDQPLQLEEQSPFQDSHLRSQNIYYLKLLNADFDDNLELKMNTIGMKVPTERLIEVQFVESLVGKAIYHFKRLGRLRSIKLGQYGNSGDLIDKLKLVYLAGLAEEFTNYSESLNYVNSNKNLVFFDKYRIQVETDLPDIKNAFATKNLQEIISRIDKKDIAIYDTVYMFEEY